MGERAFNPRSSAALQRERDLEFRVRQLLTTGHGVHDPHIVLIEEEPDRLVALYTVESLTGRAAHTAFITPDPPGDPEVTLVAGFVF